MRISEDHAPPPRPTATPARVALTELWQNLPESIQQQLLQTVSRIVRQQSAPPANKEVKHE